MKEGKLCFLGSLAEGLNVAPNGSYAGSLVLCVVLWETGHGVLLSEGSEGTRAFSGAAIDEHT